MIEKITDVLFNVLFLILSPILLLISLILFFALPSRDEFGYINECSGCKMGQDKNYCKNKCRYYKQIEEEKKEYGRKMDTNSGTSS
nr:MAG TPA: Big defensin [Caudoviricetes sp.]